MFCVTVHVLQRRRNSTAFADLQAKLLQAQEEQRQETMKHYETQTEFQEYMRRQLEEQSKQQMMVRTEAQKH